MKVRLLTRWGGDDHALPGDVVEMSADLAAHHIARRTCVAVDGSLPIIVEPPGLPDVFPGEYPELGTDAGDATLLPALKVVVEEAPAPISPPPPIAPRVVPSKHHRR